MKAIQKSVIECLNVTRSNYVDIPVSIFHTIQCHVASAEDLSPESLASRLRQTSRYISMSKADKKNILSYLFSDRKNFEKVKGLKLLPLNSEEWETFDKSTETVYVCSSIQNAILHGRQRNVLLQKSMLGESLFRDLTYMAECGLFQLRVMNVENMKRFIDVTRKEIQRASKLLAWLKDVWRYITEENLLSYFKDTRIFPVLKKGTWDSPKAIELASLTDLLLVKSDQRDELPDGLCRCFETMGITVIPSLPEWMPKDFVKTCLFWPRRKSVISLLSKVWYFDSHSKSITAFNRACTWEDKQLLLSFLSEDVSLLTDDAINCVKELHLFRAVKIRNEQGKETSVSTTARYVCENEDFPEKVPYPFTCVSADKDNEPLLRKLGSHQANLHELVLEKLKYLKIENDSLDVPIFMDYFVNKFFLLQINREIVECASQIKFVKAGSHLHKPKDLFDPSDQSALNLLHGECLIPDFGKSLDRQRIYCLKSLGLKGMNDIDANIVLQVARSLERSKGKHTDKDLRIKADEFMRLLRSRPSLLEEKCLNGYTLGASLKNISCIIVQARRVPQYPECIDWFSYSGLFCKPSEAKDVSFCLLVGAVLPTVVCSSEKINSCFGLKTPPRVTDVILQLEKIKASYSKEYRSDIVPMLSEIYAFLANNQDELKDYKQSMSDKELIWTGDGFVSVEKVMITHKDEDVDLRPYFYVLPQEFEKKQRLFSLLGCRPQQDANILLSTLHSIKAAHKHTQKTKFVKRDKNIARNILDKLAYLVEYESYSVEQTNTLILVKDTSETSLNLVPVSSCVYDDDPDVFYDDEEYVHFVHETIHPKTASLLGVKSISKRALLNAEELGVEDWGQNEKLTMRIKALLDESYTDGVSVPKELIQNADDAGASTIKFMYDERQNTNARKRVFSKDMKSFQGPALWIYNDSLFTDSDFQNITKLNAASKEKDVRKIGKFGLGFCSVYNLTDVPSFLSGKNIVFFDPHEKHFSNILCQRSKGLKYRLPNKTLVSRYIDQFKPYDGIFGCNIADFTISQYSGTLFRLPLRTEQQASESEISMKAYTKREMLKLLEMFMKAAGNFLLFTQNIKSIEIYHLPSNARTISEEKLLYSLNKDVLLLEKGITTTVNESVLSRLPHVLESGLQFSETHKVVFSQKMPDYTKRIIRGVGKDNVPERSNTAWIIAWALGIDKALFMHKELFHQGSIPLSAVAVPVDRFNLVDMKRASHGFYREGHLYCFLPLPLKTKLPVHINGCFAVSSSRRQLATLTEDDKDSKKNAWNNALMEDSSVIAQVNLLKVLAENDHIKNSTYKYYELWPLQCEPLVITFKEAFYRHIIVCNEPVFKGREKWVGYEDVTFLDPGISRSEMGQLAFEFLDQFPSRDDKTLIEMPSNIYEYLKTCNSGIIRNIQKAVIEERELYLHFLSKIHEPCWNKRLRDRNRLILAALNVNDFTIRHKMENTICIPTSPDNSLSKPAGLIHPNSYLAKLFEEDEHRFPLNTNDFRDKYILQKLVELGMKEDTLPSELFIERCVSVQAMASKCCRCALDRSKNILKYMCKQNVILLLQNDRSLLENVKELWILPVLQKPKRWPFSWKANAVSPLLKHFKVKKACENKSHRNSSMVLGRPKDLFREAVKEYVGGVGFVFDETVLSVSVENFNQLCELLDLKGMDLLPLKLVVDQVLNMAWGCKNKSQIKEVIKIHDILFRHFNKVVEANPSESEISILNALRSSAVILIGDKFVKAQNIAFDVKEECRPHLYRLPEQERLTKKHLYTYLGVKVNFTVEDILGTMDILYKKGHKTSNIKDVNHLLVNLHDSMKQQALTYEDITQYHDRIVAPDIHSVLWPTYELVLENNDFETSFSMKIMHKIISSQLGTSLGVKPKKLRCFEELSIGISFGQQERLVTRIRGLLKAYPRDASIMRELLQNADDAGASEIHFIKDYRFHSTEKLFQTCGSFQGPSLCVYNDSYFKQEDIEGIHSLGQGSKKDDPTKTGQYGVGFNSVYHLTDTPSFLTKGPEIENGGHLIILDPMCTHVPNATRLEPGVMLNVDALKETSFSDYLLGFSVNDLIRTDTGTVFRFPLRSESSDISEKIVDQETMDTILKSFEKEMFEAVIFLKNITCIKISNITSGTLSEEYKVRVKLSKIAEKERKDFNENAYGIANANKSNKDQNLNSSPIESIYPIQVGDSRGKKKHFLVVQRFGIDKTYSDNLDDIKERLRNGDLGLLPIGGVAFPLNKCLLGKRLKLSKRKLVSHSLDIGIHALNESTEATANSSVLTEIATFWGKAFCFLPLPIETGLPVHVNAHFALDHEARRGLWKEGYRHAWNCCVAEALIVPAWASGVRHISELIQVMIEKASSTEMVEIILKNYHCYVPLPNHIHSQTWRHIADWFYSYVVTNNVPLFCYIFDNRSEIPAPDGIFDNSSNRFRAFWICVDNCRDQYHHGIFNTIFSHMCESDLPKAREDEVYLIEQLLLTFGLKLLRTPDCVREAMLTTGLDNIPTATPDLVIAFMKSYNTEGDECCDVGQLNTNIAKTKFRTPENLYIFIKYMVLDRNYYQKTEGLPVLLTADVILKQCSKKAPVYISKYSPLLPRSKREFMHERICPAFSDEISFRSDCFRRFSFDDFVKLLPASLDVDTYTKTRSISVQGVDYKYGIISGKWLCMFFAFCSAEKVNNGGKLKAYMGVLQDWCLLPCLQSDSKRSLIPFREYVNLLHLDEIQKQDAFGKALESLRLPTLDITAFNECDMQELVESALIKCVASPERPKELLQCLVNHRQSISSYSTAEAGNAILAFFERHLETVSKQMDHDNLKQTLRKLPLFVTQEGTLTDISGNREVFVFPERMPFAGLQKWARACNVTLLLRNDSLEQLHKFLELQQTNIGYVYGWKILPMFHELSRKCWLDHIDFIRQHLQYWPHEIQQKIIDELKRIAFINISGEMKKADELYDPKNKIFKHMKDQGHFPPSRFLKHNWWSFLKKLGMVTDLNDEMLVEFAQQIETESNNRLTDSVRSKSRLLYDRFIENTGIEWQTETLHKIRSIRFFEPVVLDSEELHIWPQYENAERLICFQGAISCEYWKLCWTSQAVLSKTISHELADDVRKELGVHESPYLNIVILHCQNVVDSLKEKTKNNSVSVAFVKQQMDCLYDYFLDQRKPVLQERLDKKPFVHIPDGNYMVRASEVITDLEPTLEIRPFLFRAPKYYGKYHELFEFLGSKTKIMFCHYAAIMDNLRAKCKNHQMHPTERSIAQSVLKGLVKLDMETDESIQEVKSICLPNTELRLIDSKTIVFSDSEIYQHRLQERIQLDIFAGPSFLDLTDNVSLEEMFKQWPAHLKPKFLTDIVTEELCLFEGTEQQGTCSEKANMIEEFLHSTELANAFYRLLKYQSSRGTKKMKYDAEYFEKEIAKRLENARVLEMQSLRTVLKYSDKPVSGSEIDIPFKIQQGHDSKYTFYFRDISHDQKLDITYILPGLMELLQLCAVGLDSLSAAYFAPLLWTVADPQKIPSLLDNLNIQRYENIHVPKREYFPRPGTYVERQFIPFLEQSIFPFFDYEYKNIAMELDDMSVIAHDNESQVYIYVRIIKELKTSEANTDLRRVYIVDTGNSDLSPEQVPIHRLYRFVRKDNEPGSEVQIYDTEPMQSKTFDAHCHRIRQDLRDAWTLPEMDWKRICRRLLLKWHPDKNRGNEKYCTDVFLFIKIVISRLENEERVTDNIAEEMNRGPSNTSSASSTYYKNINKRAKTYARSYYDNFDDYSRSERTGPYSHFQATTPKHPDQGEANRWLRQAKKDILAAGAMMTAAGSVDGYNWVCYTCHQACEKALKSERYFVDANDVPRGKRSHFLTTLTDDRKLKKQVQTLEERLGGHARLRYPDAVSRPQIPSDMFSREDAEFSIGIAKSVISTVEENIS